MPPPQTIEEGQPGGEAGGRESHLSQDGAIITPRSVYGNTAALLGKNSLCLDGKQLLYPCGIFCSVFTAETNEMSFVAGHDKVRCMVGIALSNNKKYLACIEDVEDSEAQQVTVYSMQTLKRVRTLTSDAVSVESTRVQGIHFSEDSKLLITQHGEPDNTLAVWRWYSGKVIVTVKVDTPVLRAAFSPVENSLFATVCATSASMHRVDVNEGTVRTLPVVTSVDAQKGQLTSFAWLVGNLLALTTNQGWIHVHQDTLSKGSVLTEEGDHLLVVAARLRGLVAGGCRGQLYFFDPADQQAKKTAPLMLVRKLNVYVPGPYLPSTVPLPDGHGAMMTRNAVLDLCVSSGEGSMAMATAGGEIVTLSLVEVQDREEKQVEQHMGQHDEHDHAPFHLLCGGFGRARIVSMDAIASPALMLTISTDRMVRLYNYESQRSIAVTQVEDDVQCCSLHPSGTQLLVGLHTGLRLYSIALDELSLRAEFPVRRCSLARFSHGGAVFAAVGRSHTIVIHHAYGHQQLAQLKGHVSAVTSLSFSSDDRMLVSCGAGGAIYFWDMSSLTRIVDLEYVDKLSIYSNVAFLSRHRGAVVRTHDGRLQHVRGGKVEYEVAGLRGGDNAPTALLGEDAVVLAATLKGTLQSFPWPTSMSETNAQQQQHAAPTPQEYRLHAPSPAGVTAMVVLPQKGLVFTASVDGTVVISHLALVLGGQLLEASVDATTASLAPQYVTVAEDRLQAMRDKQMELLGLVAATKSASEYQTFRQTQALRDIINKLQDELNATQAILEKSEADVARLLTSAAEKERSLVKELESSHMSAAEELELLYERRLEMEAAKLRQMAAAMDDARFRAEEAMVKQKQKAAEEVKALQQKHKAEIAELEARLQEAMASQAQFETFHNEFAMQAEVDFDDNRDRLERRIDDAGKAAEAREAKMRADNNLLKRTCLRLKGDKAIEMKKMDKMMVDNNVLREGLGEQRVTINKLRQELEERDSVMADNYTTIQMLRRRIQDLEKHKYVLGYKAQTYEARLQPKIEEAAKLASELEAHDRELISELNHVNELTRAAGDKDRLIKSLKQEIADTKLAMKHQGDQLRMFSYDVNQVWNASDDVERGAGGAGAGPASGAVRGGRSQRHRLLEELYKKYCIEGAAPKSSDEVEAELTRHLHMSELRGAVLEHRLNEAGRQGRMAQRVAVHENVQLLQELQINTQDSKEVSRQLEAVQSELRELNTRYKILEARARGAGMGNGGGGDASGSGQSGNEQDGGGFEPGSSSMAGRVGPSRPSSAWPVNRSWAAGGASGSSRPASAAPGGKGNMYRNAGGTPPGGNVSRGSPARVLQELIGAERERVSELMAQLHASATELDRQRGVASAAAAAVHTLNSAAAAAAARSAGADAAGTSGDGFVEEDGEEGGDLEAANAAVARADADVAKAIKRHGSASNHNAARRPASALPKGPTAYGTTARRRPTSAAGMGMRAFVNGSLKSWRET